MGAPATVACCITLIGISHQNFRNIFQLIIPEIKKPEHLALASFLIKIYSTHQVTYARDDQKLSQSHQKLNCHNAQSDIQTTPKIKGYLKGLWLWS
jgi:hypothetical protein